MDMEEQKPIFITGSVRSGTSIVTHALRSGAKIPGYTEGCFIEFLGALLRNVNETYTYRERQSQLRNPDIMLSGIDKDEFVKEYIRWFIDQYVSHSKYSGQWVDKTASRNAVYSLPYIQQAWPQARFIIMKRRPIENIASRLKKFPNPTFEAHCVWWITLEKEIMSVKKQLQKGTFLEIDQFDVATKPKETAQQIGVFLNLSIEQIRRVEASFLYDRPEFTGGDEETILSLDEMPWTDEQKAVFLETCGPVAEERGWSLGKTYYATAP